MGTKKTKKTKKTQSRTKKKTILPNAAAAAESAESVESVDDKDATASPASHASPRKSNLGDLKEKWGVDLIAAGWVAIPTTILDRQTAIGLDAADVTLILHILKHWWTADNLPHPSKSRIATAMGWKPRAVQKRLQRLEKDGLIQRIERRESARGSLSSLYKFDGLITAATKFAKEELEARERERAAKAARYQRKRPKNDGQK